MIDCLKIVKVTLSQNDRHGFYRGQKLTNSDILGHKKNSNVYFVQKTTKLKFDLQNTLERTSGVKVYFSGI